MKLWMSLYGMIWIVLVEFLLAMTPTENPNVRGVLVGIHAGLGLAILALAGYNFSGLRTSRVPGRVKRTAKSTFQLSVAMAVLGVLLVLRVGDGLVIPLISISVLGIILLVHVVNAFAIITQAAAVAIAYDMWEEKEFTKETASGEVPAQRMPAKSPVPTMKP